MKTKTRMLALRLMAIVAMTTALAVSSEEKVMANMLFADGCTPNSSAVCDAIEAFDITVCQAESPDRDENSGQCISYAQCVRNAAYGRADCMYYNLGIERCMTSREINRSNAQSKYLRDRDACVAEFGEPNGEDPEEEPGQDCGGIG